MDRQTIRYPDGAVELKCSVNDAVMLLAEYEDTGREPEELTTVCKLCEDYVSAGLDVGFIQACINAVQSGMNTEHITKITKAESEGRLIILPCKVGDTVWRIIGPKSHRIVQQRKVLAVTIYHTGDMVIHTDGAENRFGKTVFLTREEAEAALERSKSNGT